MNEHSPNGLTTSADPKKGFLGGGISKKLLGIIIAGIFLLLMFTVYIISQKGQHKTVDEQIASTQKEASNSGSDSSNGGMNEILNQAPDKNRITPSASLPTLTSPKTTIDEKAPLLTSPAQPQESEVDRKQRLNTEREQTRIRQLKEQQFQAALTAQSSVNVDMKDDSPNGSPPQQASVPNLPQQPQILAENDPNNQASKMAFAKEKHSNTYLLQGREQPLSPYELKVGTVIPATLISGINSDLPGQVIASVSQNVYDSATGSHLLLPQGAKLYGVYDSNVSYGQDRLLMAWTRVNYPDGTTLELDGMGGIDAQGYAGFEDQVDHHYWKIFGNAFILGMITGATEAGVSDNNSDDNTTAESVSNGVAEQFAETGSTLIEKNLDVQPTIKIRNGYKFNVMLNKDVILQPYRPI
jgi:type IV secretion system protein VirB10